MNPSGQTTHHRGTLTPDALRRLREARAEGVSWAGCVERFGRSEPFLKAALGNDTRHEFRWSRDGAAPQCKRCGATKGSSVAAAGCRAVRS